MNTRTVLINDFMKKQKGKCYECDEELTGMLALQFNEDPEWGGKEDSTNIQLVHTRCASRGPKHRRKSLAWKLKREGNTPKQIATMMQLSLATVYSYLKLMKS